jgi:hypothetical protein
MTEIQEVRQAFKFLKIFEDAVDEVATQTDSCEVCEEIRRRVVDRVLNEMKLHREVPNENGSVIFPMP